MSTAALIIVPKYFEQIWKSKADKQLLTSYVVSFMGFVSVCTLTQVLKIK